MKKIVAFIVLVVISAATSSVFAQTRQESRQIDELNQRISQENSTIITTQAGIKELSWMQKKIQSLRWEVASLDSSMAHAATKAEYRTFQHRADQKREFLADLRAQYLEDSTNNVWRANSITERRKVVVALTEERDKIFLRYNTSTEVPKELGVCEYNARNRGFSARRQELVIAKIENNLGTVDPAITVNSGYKTILDNQYVMPVEFKISPVNGGEATSLVVKPGQKTTTYLLPGTYSVSFFNGGKQMGHAITINIDGQVKNYQGESCFAFAYMPRW